MKCSSIATGFLSLWCIPFSAVATDATREPLPRAVSVDYCADQYLLALGAREQILAVSSDAQQDFSYYADAAAGIPQLHSSSEELIALAPDIVVNSWGWSARDRQLPERLGINFVQVQFGESPEVIAGNLRAVAAALGRPEEAERVIKRMRAQLASVIEWDVPDDRPTAVYITPAGTTSGAGTLIDSLMQLAGVRNSIAEQGYSGWRDLQLEELVMHEPDIFIASFFELESQLTDNWNISRHSVMQDLLADKPVIVVPSKLLACSAWYFLDAVELIQAEVATTMNSEAAMPPLLATGIGEP